MVEVIDKEYQIIPVEQNSFSCKTITVTVTETVTVDSSDCYNIYNSLNMTPKILKHCSI